MSLWKYKYFVDVVDCGSFTKAGKKNFVTQTAISQQISSLEKSVGGKLLERGSGELVITELGEIVYGHAKQMLEINEEMKREVELYKQKFVTRIGIDCSINKRIWAKMQNMIDTYYTEEEFQFSKLDNFLGSRMLEEGALDFYIGYGFHQTNPKVAVESIPLCRSRMGVYLGPNTTIQKEGEITLQDLEGYTQYATKMYPCGLSMDHADVKYISNFDTMKLKVDFNDGYAFADSYYFAFYDGYMKLLSDVEEDCVIKIFYRPDRNRKKLKDVLEKIKTIFECL